MIFFLLPALNEAEIISGTLGGIHYQMSIIQKEYQIIVCDNGSTDNTASIAEQNNAIVTRESKKGYGYTLMQGIKYIQKNYTNISDKEKILIFMDSDGQDSEENIHIHLQNLRTVDFSIGSRIKSSSFQNFAGSESEAVAEDKVNCETRDGRLGEKYLGSSSKRKNEPIVDSSGSRISTDASSGMTDGDATSSLHTLANKFFGFLLWMRTGKKFTDLGPFRALRMDTFLDLDMKEYTYGWTAEMQKKIAQKNISFREFYSAPKKREKGQSKVSESAMWKQIRIGLYIIWVIVK